MKRRMLSDDFLWEVDVDGGANTEVLIDRHFRGALASDFLDRTLSADIGTYLPGDLLVKVDRMTMAHSLEGRSPFLDYQLAERVARLPAEMKMPRGQLKYLLKRALGDFLPPELRRRPKQGFGIPIGLWLREPPLRSRAQEAIERLAATGWFHREELNRYFNEHQSARADHGKRLWALIALDEWRNQYLK